MAEGVLPPEGKQHERLKEIVLSAAPREAAGLLMPDGSVIELTNTAENPETNFEIRREELLAALTSISPRAQGLTLWHSHPGGGVGPSRTDIRQKLPFLHHLVVTLVDDDVVYTYY